MSAAFVGGASGLQSVGEDWQRAFPTFCPVNVRDGRGVSMGACWEPLHGGRCALHGDVYAAEGGTAPLPRPSGG